MTVTHLSPTDKRTCEVPCYRRRTFSKPCARWIITSTTSHGAGTVLSVVNKLDRQRVLLTTRSTGEALLICTIVVSGVDEIGSCKRSANTAANMHLLHVICTAHCAALRCAARVYRVSVHAATALRRKHVDQALYKAQRTAGWFLVYSAAPTDNICENSILGYSTPISKLPLLLHVRLTQCEM